MITTKQKLELLINFSKSLENYNTEIMNSSKRTSRILIPKYKSNNTTDYSVFVTNTNGHKGYGYAERFIDLRSSNFDLAFVITSTDILVINFNENITNYDLNQIKQDVEQHDDTFLTLCYSKLSELNEVIEFMTLFVNYEK